MKLLKRTKKLWRPTSFTSSTFFVLCFVGLWGDYLVLSININQSININRITQAVEYTVSPNKHVPRFIQYKRKRNWFPDNSRDGKKKEMPAAVDGIRLRCGKIQVFPMLSHFYDVFLSFFCLPLLEMECLRHQWHQVPQLVKSKCKLWEFSRSKPPIDNAYKKQKHKRKSLYLYLNWLVSTSL